MTRYTPIGYLPGTFVGAFDDESVLCTWKGHPDYTLLYFFAAPVPGEDEGCKNLLCLEFDFVFSDMQEAKAIAEESWAKYKEKILAGNGQRVSVAWHPKSP